MLGADGRIPDEVFCIYNNLKSWMVSDTQEIIELGTVKGMMRQFMWI